MKEFSAGNGENTVAYIQWCQSLYPDKPLLYLWDGASYHRGAEMQEFLTRENAGVAPRNYRKIPKSSHIKDLQDKEAA